MTVMTTMMAVTVMTNMRTKKKTGPNDSDGDDNDAGDGDDDFISFTTAQRMLHII